MPFKRYFLWYSLKVALLLRFVKVCQRFVVLSRHSSRSRTPNRKQMDVHVIFFDEIKQKVFGTYRSHFMGHTTASEVFASWNKVGGGVDLTQAT